MDSSPCRGFRRSGDFPIVGIDASAGGLEALEQFLRQVPPASGLAYVVVQHLEHRAFADFLDRIWAGAAPQSGEVRIAVDMAARGDYALILMDMQLPTMDGVIATHLIRASATGRQVPIVAMTANAFAEDRKRCIDAGMNDFIAKPFVPDDLFAMILKWLAREKR